MSPRLALAAVGQMAIPFHSAWVVSNALWNTKHVGFQVELIESPILVIKKIAGDLFLSRDRLLGPLKKIEFMMRLELAVELRGRPDANERPEPLVCIRDQCIRGAKLPASGINSPRHARQAWQHLCVQARPCP